MALTIEDGTIVAGANSYVTVAEAVAFAQARGEVFPTLDADVEPLLIGAMDYLEGFRTQFSGSQVEPGVQDLQYPRVDSTVDGLAFPSDKIPKELKYAQMQLAIDKYAIGDLAPTETGYAVAKEKVDVLEVEYATGGRLSGASAPAEPSFPKADKWLEPLFGQSGSWLRTVRV